MMSSPTSSPSSPTTGSASMNWQYQLQIYCRATGMRAPDWTVVSDRRGGRTAWSSTVTIEGRPIASARYWYDGQFINNAKEDAAEVALQHLRAISPQGQTSQMGQRRTSWRA